MKKKRILLMKNVKIVRTIMENLTGVWLAKKMCRITL